MIGIILILLTLGLYCMTQQEPPPEPTPEPETRAPAKQEPAQSAQFGPAFEIPAEEPDTGPPVDTEPRRRIVYVDRPSRGAWNCSGSIPVSAVRRVVAEQRRQVRNCYERALKRDSTLQGSVNVRVKVGSSGRVEGVRVSGSLRDREVFSCVRTLANQWSFPNPEGGCAVVAAPFSLSPRN